MIDRTLEGRQAWMQGTLGPDAGLVPVPAACMGEIEAVVATLRANPLPVLALAPGDFELPACRAMMAAVPVGPGL